jgi:hypothetical protein
MVNNRVIIYKGGYLPTAKLHLGGNKVKIAFRLPTPTDSECAIGCGIGANQIVGNHSPELRPIPQENNPLFPSAMSQRGGGILSGINFAKRPKTKKEEKIDNENIKFLF